MVLPTPPRSPVLSALVGLLVAALFGALREGLVPVIGFEVQFILAYPAVFIAALLGGATGGLSAAATSAALAAYLWFPPIGRFALDRPGDRVAVVLFLLSSSAIALLIEVGHRLRHELDRERRIVEASQELALFGAYTWDLRRARLWWSPGMLRILGVDRPLDRQATLAMVHPDDRERVAATVNDVLAGHAQRFEEMFRIRTAHGERWVSTHGLIEHDGEGRPVSIVGGAVDITDQQRAYMELLRVFEENRGLAAAKNEFLARVSHEMRTPLNVALGRVQMLLRGQVAQERRHEVLAAAYRNLQSTRALVSDLLEGSRITAGCLELAQQRVSLVDVLESVIADAQPVAEERGVRLELVPPAQPACIDGDAERLTQVFANLVHNSVKFTDAGGVVRVSLARDGQDARVIVSDTGHGIPAEEMPHIFEPFRQADPTGAREHGGLGLGLAIVKYLVEKHQGQIEVSSPGRDQGATFTVTLPLVADVESA